MFLRSAVLLLVALSALPALSAERPSSTPPPATAPAPGSVPQLIVGVPIHLFELVKQLFESPPPPTVRLEPLPGQEGLAIRQVGDPDSVVSPGSATPSHRLSLKASFEINDLLLKAYEPDPTVDPNDNKTRGAAAYSPLDARGRPLQLRFGARLVW